MNLYNSAPVFDVGGGGGGGGSRKNDYCAAMNILIDSHHLDQTVASMEPVSTPTITEVVDPLADRNDAAGDSVADVSETPLSDDTLSSLGGATDSEEGVATPASAAVDVEAFSDGEVGEDIIPEVTSSIVCSNESDNNATSPIEGVEYYANNTVLIEKIYPDLLSPISDDGGNDITEPEVTTSIICSHEDGDNYVTKPEVTSSVIDSAEVVDNDVTKPEVIESIIDSAQKEGSNDEPPEIEICFIDSTTSTDQHSSLAGNSNIIPTEVTPSGSNISSVGSISEDYEAGDGGVVVTRGRGLRRSRSRSRLSDGQSYVTPREVRRRSSREDITTSDSNASPRRSAVDNRTSNSGVTKSRIQTDFRVKNDSRTDSEILCEQDLNSIDSTGSASSVSDNQDNRNGCTASPIPTCLSHLGYSDKLVQGYHRRYLPSRQWCQTLTTITEDYEVEPILAGLDDSHPLVQSFERRYLPLNYLPVSYLDDIPEEDEESLAEAANEGADDVSESVDVSACTSSQQVSATAGRQDLVAHTDNGDNTKVDDNIGRKPNGDRNISLNCNQVTPKSDDQEITPAIQGGDGRPHSLARSVPIDTSEAGDDLSQPISYNGGRTPNNSEVLDCNSNHDDESTCTEVSEHIVYDDEVSRQYNELLSTENDRSRGSDEGIPYDESLSIYNDISQDFNNLISTADVEESSTSSDRVVTDTATKFSHDESLSINSEISRDFNNLISTADVEENSTSSDRVVADMPTKSSHVIEYSWEKVDNSAHFELKPTSGDDHMTSGADEQIAIAGEDDDISEYFAKVIRVNEAESTPVNELTPTVMTTNVVVDVDIAQIESNIELVLAGRKESSVIVTAEKLAKKAEMSAIFSEMLRNPEPLTPSSDHARVNATTRYSDVVQYDWEQVDNTVDVVLTANRDSSVTADVAESSIHDVDDSSTTGTG